MRATSLLREYRYELIAFLTGAAVMILEIVGARLIAPVFGTSTYVWTAMIGVILGSLAIGYAVGGKMADRDDSARYLGRILFVAALLVLLMAIAQHSVLEAIARMGLDLRLSALFAAILLFGLPSALIGMVSPHLAKIRVTSLESTGFSIGRLEAAGALGSIAGTFSCGYFLLGAFGSRSIVIGVVVMLLATSFIADPLQRYKRKAWVIVAAILFGALFINVNPPYVLADVDSSYARYQVKTMRDPEGKYSTNYLATDRSGFQSAASPQYPDALLFGYTNQFQLTAQRYGNPGKVLVIGGGAFTFPGHLVKTFPDVRVDAVEIDPALNKLAAQYFNYKPSPRLQIHHSDGRAYLNTNTTPYNLVYMDAFSSLNPPFQLTTRQTVERIENSLTEDGVAVVNVIAAYENGGGDYARAITETYKSVFRYVSLHPLDSSAGVQNGRQNLLLFASNNAGKYAAVTAPLRYGPLALQPGGLVLTDDYAPIERLTF